MTPRGRQEGDGVTHDPRPFRVLFVCTANMCRSPLAEHLFAEEVERRDGSGHSWAVASAGTHVTAGTEVHELVREVLAERGLPVPRASSHQVVEADVESADLILTAAREHRSWIVTRVPSAVRRTFTLRQFARLCAAGWREVGAGAVLDPSHLLDLVTVGRRVVGPVSEEEDLVVDPMGGSIEDFRTCAEQISDAVRLALSPVPC